MRRLTPCVVLDTETTGFPNNGQGHCGRLIEVGAVVVTQDARIVSPVSFLVRQEREHLSCAAAQRAQRVHGISPQEVLRDGLDPHEAAPRFAQWLERVRQRHGVQEVRAYNQAFDFWFLQRTPWSMFERTGLVPGEDVQQVAKRAMQAKRRPRLSAAVSFAQEQGHDVGWSGAAHRALQDALMAAHVAICLHSPAG